MGEILPLKATDQRSAEKHLDVYLHRMHMLASSIASASL